jgi:hypothetical protein
MGLRLRKPLTLSHNGGCTRQWCSPSGPMTLNESNSALTAVRPRCLDVEAMLAMCLYVSSS